MCHANCCCNNLNTDNLKKFSLVFILINVVISAIAIFVRAANTNRYEQALIYLEQRNNGTFNVSLYNCSLDGFWNDEIYCDYEGKRLRKPDDNVGNQSLFKNWKKVELILDISRLIITAIFLVFFYFALNKKNEEDKKNNLLSYSNAILIFLVADSVICIIIRALTIGTNQNIGLYEVGNQNEFEFNTALNYILDIIIIVLTCIVICFVIRLQRPPTKEVVPVPVPVPVPVRQPPPQPEVRVAYVGQIISVGTTQRYIHPLEQI